MSTKLADIRFRIWLALRPERLKEKLAQGIAVRLPKRVVYFVAIRMAAKIVDEDPFQLNFGDVLNKYDFYSTKKGSSDD